MRRLADWQTQLTRAIEDARGTPFELGTQDCALFAGRCLEALTGLDFWRPFAGRYKTAVEWRALLEGRDLPAVVDELTGEPRIAPGAAWRGDLVFCPTMGRQALGVCVGAQYATTGARGLAFRPMGRALFAWAVGHG